MNRELDIHHRRRLALVRQLHGIGVRQTRQVGAASALGLLPLHDAVEMFLLVLCDLWGAEPTRKTDFIQYFDLLATSGCRLEHRESMKRLNGARVLLKHSGIGPGATDVEALRAATTNFFEDNAPDAVGLEFAQLSLSGAVANAEVRQHLVEAETALAAGNLTDAMTGAAVAFSLTMTEPNTPASRTLSGERRFTLRSAALGGLGTHVPFGFTRGRDSQVENYIHKLGTAVTGTAEVFGEAITVLGAGLDLARYLEFKSQSPVVWVGFGREPSLQWMRDGPDNPEVVSACVAFAVDAALVLGPGPDVLQADPMPLDV